MNAIERKINAAALRVISRKFPRPAVIKRYSLTYDFVTNSRSEAPEQVVDVAISPVVELRRFLGDEDSTATSRCYMAGEGAPIVPDTRCYLFADDKIWKIEEVVTHSAGTTVAAYEMRLKDV